MILKYIISSSIGLSFIFSIAAQDGKQREKVQPENIENIKIQEGGNWRQLYFVSGKSFPTK